MADYTFRMAGLTLNAPLDPPASPEPAALSTKNPALCSPPNVTVIDRDGDLYLVVGPEKRAFRVDSRALVRVSSVWRPMLTGGWAESRPESGTWKVNLPSNDPGAIEILLNIIHLNVRQIPRASEVGIERLYHVAVAVDMYDLSGCLGLWANSWCTAVVPVAEVTEDVEALTQLSCIAWVFGDRSLFQCVLDRLVLKVEVDGDGRLVDAEGRELANMDLLMAMGLLDHLAATRTWLITLLLAVLEAPLQNAIATSKTAKVSPFCRSTAWSAMQSDNARSKARADCTAVFLGSLIQALAAANLFPYPSDPKDIFESVSALKQRLVWVVERIETLGFPSDVIYVSMHREAHADCCPRGRLLKSLNGVLGPPGIAPTVSQTKHLEKMAKQIGWCESVRKC